MLDMGQLLSLPFVAVGAYYMWKGLKKGRKL
jgi:prolipoprotein diacylglyceryltransferase